MNHLLDHQADNQQQESAQQGGLTNPTTLRLGSDAGSQPPQPETTEVMLDQLEYLLKTHGDEEARSDQSSLGDILAGLRNLAGDLGLDFDAALAGSGVASVVPRTVAGSNVVSGEPPTLSAFDPCI